MVSWIDVTENRHVGRRSHLRPKDTLAEGTFPPHNAAEYIEHAQLLAMDYPNMLTADAVRNKRRKHVLVIYRSRPEFDGTFYIRSLLLLNPNTLL